MTGVHPAVAPAIDAMRQLAAYQTPPIEAQRDLDAMFQSLPALLEALGARTHTADRLGTNSFADPAAMGNVRETGTGYRTVANGAHDLYTRWRTVHAGDLAAVEAPRPDESKTNV